jgi:two-component system cell cycle sensor histidine kinase/response regulator CckA
MLEKLGHEVIIANSGREAVISYQGNRDRIDLVIMDMIMPDMGGGEAIEQIKSINPDVKIILSSGYSLNGMARKIMNRGGVQGFLQKPFQVHQLVDTINEIIDA